ncbi:hypothetical protein [Actinopolymorpha alba]|uniref:hypothetical protein n=1 Tax=Actinopolymorpha alba TaxID=533267 RepID=UPI0003651D45|nr:hypothetical protein [Actinopolymorpha alba]
MDVQHKLDEIRRRVENARSMPLSASCLINRPELLAALVEVQRLLPSEFAEARAVLEHSHEVVNEGRAEAQRLVEEGRRERTSLINNTQIHHDARQAADELLVQAREEAEGLRREVDDYVDHKLAGFEIALQKTLASVARGRDRLHDGGGPPVGNAEAAAVRQEVDEYVEQKLSRFEQSLHKTLDAVTRGRDRLRDRSGLDTFTEDEDAPPLPGG